MAFGLLGFILSTNWKGTRMWKWAFVREWCPEYFFWLIFCSMRTAGVEVDEYVGQGGCICLKIWMMGVILNG